MATRLLIDVTRTFPGLRVAARIETDLAPTRVLVLFGPSGSGKTTILRMIAGLERPDRGTIRVGEATWFADSARVDLPPQARRIGYLSQSYDLFLHLSVLENVAYGAANPIETTELLERFGVANLAHRLPAGLSGGEKQRIALARAVARRPSLLLLDEPLSALDAPTRQSLRGELRTLIRQAGVPAILVTHDRSEALALGDSIAVVIQGAVAQTGTVEDVFNRPSSVEVAEATGVETVLPVALRRVDGDLLVARHEESGVELSAVASGEPSSGGFAVIRAQDVTIETAGEARGSARNHLPGTLRSITLEDPLVRLHIDCGFPLTALITRRSLDDLALAPGTRLTATIKATSIHIIPR